MVSRKKSSKPPMVKMRKLDADHLNSVDIEHALQFLWKKHKDGNFGSYASDRYDLVWRGRRFPPKLVIATASRINGQKPLGSLEFSGGEGGGKANEFLRSYEKDVDCKIVSKKGRARGDIESIGQGSEIIERSFLLTWNPKKFPWQDELEDAHKRFTEGDHTELEWSFSATRKARIGDRVFLMKLGKSERKGIFLSGRIIGLPALNDRRHLGTHRSKGKISLVRFEIDRLINPEYVGSDSADILGLDRLLDIEPDFQWTPRGSGIEIPSGIAGMLAKEWDGFVDRSVARLASRQRVIKEFDSRIKEQPLSATEKEAIVKLRIGQSYFRDEVCKVEKRCRITKIEDVNFLIASHIKPWSESTARERLDRYNGLLLAPHIDKLFDSGRISFSDAGELLVKDDLVITILHACGIDIKTNVGRFEKGQLPYLKWHRERYGF